MINLRNLQQQLRKKLLKKDLFKREKKEKKKLRIDELSVQNASFSISTSTTKTKLTERKGTPDMKYEADISINDCDQRLVNLKDRSNRSKPGKYAARPKTEKPRNSYFAKLEDECKKESIRDISVCKRRISQARYKRRKAEAEGRETHRQESRYYLCYRHEVPQFHLTKLAEDEYNQKVANSSGKEYSLAS